jgi:hypothetical protein
VATQMPVAGTSIDQGTTCELWLERVPVAVASLTADQ